MKTILNSKRHHLSARISIFLIIVILTVGTVGCVGGTSIARYTLTMAVAPSGSGTATDLTNASPYAAGTVIDIRAAVANAGYQFVGWTAATGTFANNNTAETTFTMPAKNIVITANFEPTWEGNGTEEGPYQIVSWYQLYNVRDYLDSCFVLMNDLDSSAAGYMQLASETADDGAGWLPIGDQDNEFTGSFDGQGYEIQDLCFNRLVDPILQAIGLFSWVGVGGVIKNLGMTNGNITSSIGVGSLIGMNEGEVSNCYVACNVTGFGVGGLVGGNLGNISNCHAACNVLSYRLDDVEPSGYAGGLVGVNGGNVTSCYAEGDVTGFDLVGGLIGGFAGYVTNCYASCSVLGNEFVGGLGGADLAIWGVGVPTVLTNCYATGNVTGNSSVGGLTGSGGHVYNSFWDIETSGQATSGDGTGENTTQMQDITTFSGASWDITAVGDPETRNTAYIWNIVDNVTYPFLSWQPIS
jgi:uncharacterized repeat protein (TIGR02543 family)